MPSAARTARRPLALLGVTTLGLAGCGLLPAADPVRGDDGAIVEAEANADVFSITVGDCTNDGDVDATEVSSVEAVPCDEPHDNEVYAAFDVDGDEFPGTDEIQVIADERCLAEFEPFVGISYDVSRLGYWPMTPTESSWGQGDREVLCLVFDVDLEKLTGSAEGLAE
ncbi:septum formation family protein [Cellulosimicrobium sp. CUA-896]|uniref:septum formation family protein n=1 Tax=Cellulosimicrobium sp. CUA-896 TaxID=1517881 RepID=UPI00096A9024|nr:septum formation family protein [Cellulosimicrobium sp. CUA-896]